MPGGFSVRHMASKFRARWRLKAKASNDYVRLGLTRLEDRVVLDAAAAAVVADINPGVPSSAPAELTPYNGSLYFSASGTNASGQAVGRELYKLDSGGGVTLVADINPGASDANPAGFTVFNGELIFAATGPQGRELYRLDAAGNVTLFADVNPGSASSSPQSLMAIDNKLFFTAEVSLGRELYIANQGGGISLVADLRPGATGSDPSDFVQFNGDLYFAATNASLRGLYRVNSQGSSTPIAINLGTGVSDPREFTEYFGNLYFSAQHPTDGRELFLMYINNSNREVVNRIANFDGTSASSSPSDFYVFQDALYFAATTQNGRELLRVINDGDADDRQFLSSDDYRQFDIAPGSSSSSPGGFATFNNTLYFAATVNGQRGLYRMSGNNVVAVTLPTGVTLPADTVLTPLSNGLYFAANGPSGRELYSLDTAGNVGLVVDLNLGTASSNPAEIVQFAGKTYFVATTADVGRELFVLGNYPSSLRVDNGVLVFRDEAGDKDNRIVAFSDGTRLHIIDQNGHSIALLTSLTGAIGAGTNEIIVPLSSLAGVNSFSINTRGGNDSVTYELSSFANTFLSQFSTVSFDGGTNNDALRFVGDGVLQATYTPDPTITGKGGVLVGSGSLTSSFTFSNLEPVDFTGFAIATLVAPDTATDVDQLTISNAKDSLFGTTDALVVAGTVGGTWIESAYFFGNGVVVVDTSAGGDGTDTVSIVSANNAHANSSLRVTTFGNGLFLQDAVVVNGAVVLASSFTIETTQLTINAAVTTNGSINLTALHDIVMSANARLASNNAPIRLIGDANGIFGGGIAMANGSLINSGSGTIFLQATDDITLGRLVTANGTNSALQVSSLAGRVLDGGDSGGANLEANGAGAVVTIHAALGVGTAGNALELAVRQLVVVTTHSAQYLSELDALERLDLRAGTGQIYLTAGGAIQDSDAELDVQAAAWNVQATAIGNLLAPLQTAIGTLTANVTSGSLYLTQVSGSLTVANVTAPDASAVVSIAVLAGELQLQTITASGANSLVVLQTPNGAIRDANGAALNLTAHAAELAATQGIGVGNALETTLAQLVANGGSGGVFLQNNGDLELGNVAGLLGLSGVTADNADLQINTTGTLLVSETVQTTGSGKILLSATSDLLVNAPISAVLGALSLSAGRDLVATINGDLSTTQGAVALAAARAISLGNGASIATLSGPITLLANQGLVATSGNFTGITLSGATLTSSSGNITLQGRGGSGTDNAGIELRQTSAITSSSGAIMITGVSLGAGSSADGVRLAVGSNVRTLTTGDITVTGTSGAAGHGLGLSDNSSINALGTGNVVLAGSGNGGGADIAWDQLTISKTGGSYTFQDTVRGDTLIVLPGAYQVRFLDGGFINNQVTFQNSGGVVLGNQNSDSLTFAGGLVSTTSVTTLQGTVATQGTALTLGTTQLVGQVTLATAGGNLTAGEVQGAGVPLTIQGGTGQVTLVNPNNIIGDLTITAGTLQLVEQDNITQGGAWHITGLAQLHAGSYDIILTNAGNSFGPLQLQAANIYLVTAGDLELQASQWQGVFQVNTPGNINVTGSLQGSGAISLQAQGDLNFTASGQIDASLLGANVNLVAGGAVAMADGALINSGSGTIFLQATDDITLGRLVTTNGTNSALQVSSLAGRVLDGGDSGGANLEANGAGAVVTIHAAQGVGTAGNALELAVRQLVVVTTNSAQYLNELDALERLDLRAGTGLIYLTAGGAIQDSDAELDVQAAAWNVQATTIGTLANPLQTAIGTLTANVTSGSLYLTQVSGDLTVASVTAPDASAVVSIAVLAGELQLQTITASGANSLVVLQTPNGAIRDANGAALNLTAHAAELAATQGIGVGDPLETALALLTANGGSGGVFLQNNGDLELGNVAGLLGLSGVTADNADLQINTTGTLLVSETVQTTGSGKILLSATSDLLVNAPISAVLGALSLSAGRDLVATANGDLSTTQGAVALAAARAISLGNGASIATLSGPITLLANGILGGGIVMADGSLINSGSGTIFLQATDDITLGRLLTTNGTNSALQVSSLAGRVLDGGDSGGANLEANGAGAVVTIHAAQGVGTAGNALELAVRQLVVVTTHSAQYLSELDALERLDLRAGTGQIYLTAGGAIQDSDAELDVQAAAWHVQATTIGNLLAPLQTAIGTLNANVTSGSLYLTQVSGSLTVANVTAPDVSAVVSIAVLAGELQLQTITASGANSLVVLQTPNGAIRDANGAALNLTAHAAELAATQGIGVGDPLETALALLTANGGSGGVFLQNNGDLELGNVAGLLGLSGVTANNADLQINTTGTLLVSQAAQTTGSGAILLTATRDILLLASLANTAGQITLIAAQDLHASNLGTIRTSSGAIQITPAGTLAFDGSIFVGTGSVTFAIVDLASQMRGVISGTGGLVKQGIGTLTLTASSLNTYSGTTDVLAGILRVDGAIGANSPAQRFTLADGTQLTGGGMVNAPIYSTSTIAVIAPTGNLILGDGSTAGFDFAGQLFVGPGQLITLRDANLAQLGWLSSIAGGGRLLAISGVVVGSGETLTGSGAVAGNVFVMPGGYVSPGAGVGVLATDAGDLNLFQNATLIVQVFGTLAGAQYDQFNVRGTVSVEGAILSLQGGLFRPANGVVFTLLANDGVDPISGRFRDTSGQALGEGSLITVGGIVAALSYTGGLGGNDITLTVQDRITIIQTPSNDTTLPSIGAGRAQMQETNFLLARSIVVAQPIITETPPPPVNTVQVEVNAANLELRQSERVRVFFRIVNGATDQDEAKQYELDPNVLRDVLGFFKRYKLQDNHYRIYLQEPGKKERLILDVHIVDGRIVPPNFRETENQGTTAPSKAATEAIPAPPASVEATPASQSEGGAADPQSVAPDRRQDQSSAAPVASPLSPATSPWDVRLRAALADDQIPLDKIGRLVRKAR